MIFHSAFIQGNINDSSVSSSNKIYSKCKLKIEKVVSGYLDVRIHQWIEENELQYDGRLETMDNILCEFYMIQMITTCQSKTRNKLFLSNNIERNDRLIEVVMLLNNHSINLAMEVLVLLTF